VRNSVLRSPGQPRDSRSERMNQRNNFTSGCRSLGPGRAAGIDRVPQCRIARQYRSAEIAYRGKTTLQVFSRQCAPSKHALVGDSTIASNNLDKLSIVVACDFPSRGHNDGGAGACDSSISTGSKVTLPRPMALRLRRKRALASENQLPYLAVLR